jgi:putative ABC transport system permease protein
MLVLILASIIIALPSAWWATNTWLSGFAYHTPIYWWMFAAVGLATLAVAAITINVQALQTARTNPAISLKIE